MSHCAFAIVEMTCDYLREPLGVEGAPLLRWKLAGAERQTAYRVRVATSEASLGSPDLWDSGRIETADQWAEYAGFPILSHCRVWWQVEVEGDESQTACAVSTWEQGIAEADWSGVWIGFDQGRDAYDPSAPYYCADDFEQGENDPFLPPPVYLRSEFKLNRFDLASATLYVSAMGLTEVSINGCRAVTGHMVPGVCDYRRRVYYLAYDIKPLLQPGSNALGCVLADGLYAGYIGLNPRQWWGAKPRLNLQLEIRFADGARMTVATDAAWKAAFGAYLYADVMHGTGYDATREPAGFDRPGYDDGAWQPVDVGAEYPHIPSAHPGVPVVAHGRLAAAVERTEDGYALDCGRCFSGVLRVRVRGERGARIDLYHAEELQDGALYLRGNRSAQAHDCYILRGEGEEVFQPEFTYHGFRYARVVVTGRAELLSAEGVMISSAIPEPASFQSENPVVANVFQMIENTRQSNLFDYPTDVCARDERLGWGAEGHFFMHTAARTMNCARFLRKWMQDIADGQLENGAFWATAPAVMMRDILPFAGDLQSDMGLHVCWLLLTVYGDYPAVRKHFPALERYFEFQRRNSDRLVRFAIARDWLDIASPSGRSDFDHGYGCCPEGLLGTAYFARSAQMLEHMASVLGMAERAAYYREQYREIRAAFHTFYGRRDKGLKNATQGAYLVAAAFDLLDPDELPVAREWVRSDFHKRGGLTCGTATTPVALYGMRALGLSEEACAFIRSERYPSLGYMAKCGATAVWERWDAIYQGQFHPHAMNAFDHIGLATLGDWMIGGLAGVLPTAPGFREISFAPTVDEAIGSASVAFESVLGKIAASWRAREGEIVFSCEIPTGARAVIELPCPEGHKVEVLKGAIVSSAVEEQTLTASALPGSVTLRIFR